MRYRRRTDDNHDIIIDSCTRQLRTLSYPHDHIMLQAVTLCNEMNQADNEEMNKEPGAKQELSCLLTDETTLNIFGDLDPEQVEALNQSR